MAGDYVRRLLPLLDVMTILFGLMLILLISADQSPSSIPNAANAVTASSVADTRIENLVGSLLAGTPILFLEVTEDNTVHQIKEDFSSGPPLGTVERFDRSAFDKLIQELGKGDLNVPTFVFYQQGLGSRKLTKPKQSALLKELGESKAFLIRKPNVRED